MTSPSDQTLEAHIMSARQKASDGEVYAFHSDARVVECELELDDGGGRWRVMYAPSDLAIRKAILERGPDERLALFTPLRNRELATDLSVRLAGREIFDIDDWETLRTLFQAYSVDPKLRQNETLGQALLQTGAREFPVSSGILSEEEAWRAFFDLALDQTASAQTLTNWLKWAVDKPHRVKALFVDYDEEMAKSLAAYLGEQRGSAYPLLFRMLRYAHDNGSHPGVEAVALGLAYRAATRAREQGDDKSTEVFCTRLEKYIGAGPNPPAEAWEALGEAAERVKKGLNLDGRTDELDTITGRLDQLIEHEAGDHAEVIAAHSSVSHLGWQSRVERAVKLLEGLMEGENNPDEVREALETLEEHSVSQTHALLIEQLWFAARLANSLRESQRTGERERADSEGLGRMARRYIREQSFVDRLREYLSLHDHQSSVAEIIGRVLADAQSRSDTINKAFAVRMADELEHTTSPVGGLAPQDVLAEVVAPVANQHRVLLVVLDGVSWAVARTLLRDPKIEDWDTWIPYAADEPRPLFATVPSVTDFSRTSLLAGELRTGGQSVEKKAFPAALRDLGAVTRVEQAKLFHKGDLGTDGQLSQEVLEALEDEKADVVGVVVNAIDDQLSGADQLGFDWNIDAVRPLASLLDSAGDRVVLIVGDHGHVWDAGSTRLDVVADSQRWRPVSDEVHDGEMRIEGPMVEALTGEEAVIVPWKEQIRYTGPQRGYHGGMSIQEVVTPLFALTRGATDLTEAGFGTFSPAEPPWWRFEQPSEPPVHSPKVDDKGQLSLGKATLADRLFASKTFERQEELTGSRAVDRERLRLLLAALEANNYRMSLEAVSREFEMSLNRTQNLIVAASSMLAVDAYPALGYDRQDNFVKLDLERLQRQFQL